MSQEENTVKRAMITVYSEYVEKIESLGVEEDRSFTNTANLLLKEALTKRGLIKQEGSGQ